MARIRTIKPSFWSDGDVADLSRDARLLAVGLISFADDQGRFLASPAAVCGYVYPHDAIPHTKLRAWMAEIAAKKIITLYIVDRREYGAFPNYDKHQNINRPSPSTLPPPP